MKRHSRNKVRGCDGGRRQAEEGIKAQEAILYADNMMVASTNLGWIQTVFDTLTGLFYQVGLKTNLRKTVVMVYHPCQADGVRSDKAYNQQMIEGGRIYKERER